MKYFKIETTASNKQALLEEVAQFALTQGITTSAPKLLDALLAREKEVSTGFEDEIAIPHARINEIKDGAIIIAVNATGIDWPSLDKKPTKIAITLLIPKNAKVATEHLKYLSTISSLLIDENSKTIFKTGAVTQVEKLVNEAIAKKEAEERSKNQPKNGAFDIVAISTCPTGVAHTNMAAEALIKAAEARGLKIKVERQAAEGIVSQLQPSDIEGAQVVIFAASKQIDGRERFIGKKLYEVKVVEPIRDAKKVINDAFAKGQIYKGTRQDTLKQAMSMGGGAKPLQALMNGVSYMIPFVVVGGILIAFALGVGGESTPTGLVPPAGSFWAALLGVGSVGFTLMIPILGGFIGSAIGGRAALAPSMIISYVIGNQDGQLWNWQSMQFGSFSQPAQLGFLGSIAAGFLCGYLVKYWRQYVSVRVPKTLKPVEPIIFIPIIMVLVAWVFFAFFGYLPLFYISKGLNEGVSYLVDKNLFFLAAIILGAMIAFDMGGPLNKIAFLLGGGFIQEGKPEVMGAIAAAIAVPPLGCGAGYFIAKYLFRLKIFDKEDQGNAVSALFMSIVGITEGAIPFAVKYPKQIMVSNVLGGAVGAAVAALFKITDQAQHGGPIVYIVGAIGKDGVTDYAWGLFFLLSIIIGGAVTAFTMVGLFQFKAIREKLSRKHNKSVSK